MNKSLTVTVESIDGLPSSGTSVLSLNEIKSIFWTTSGAPLVIVGISKAAAAVLTVTAHGLTSNDLIFITGVTGVGFTALNNTQQVVTVIDPDTFSIPVDSSGYSGTYGASSGSAQVEETNIIVALPTDNGIREAKYIVTEGFGAIDALKSQRLVSATVTAFDGTTPNFANGSRIFVSPFCVNAIYVDKLLIETFDVEGNMEQYKASALNDNLTCFNFDCVSFDGGQAGYNDEIEIPVSLVYSITSATNSVIFAHDVFQDRIINYVTNQSAANIVTQVSNLGL
jgi:hypothetical protein